MYMHELLEVLLRATVPKASICDILVANTFVLKLITICNLTSRNGMGDAVKK